MSSSELSKTQFKENYNVVKVLTNKTDIMKQLETFNSNNQAVAFGIKKKPKATLEDIVEALDKIKTRLDNIETRIDNIETRIDNIETRLDNIETRIDNIETRLDNIETRLDQHDALFKKHGWIDK